MAQDSKTSCSVLCCIKLVCHTLMPYSIAGSGRRNLRNLYGYSDFFFASSAFYINAVAPLYRNKLSAFAAQLITVYNIFYKITPHIVYYTIYCILKHLFCQAYNGDKYKKPPLSEGGTYTITGRAVYPASQIPFRVRRESFPTSAINLN